MAVKQRIPNQIRLEPAIMETARHISAMTGMSITAVIEEACRGYFKAWLQGASAALTDVQGGKNVAP